jgi:hypothetical protein
MSFLLKFILDHFQIQKMIGEQAVGDVCLLATARHAKC